MQQIKIILKDAHFEFTEDSLAMAKQKISTMAWIQDGPVFKVPKIAHKAWRDILHTWADNRRKQGHDIMMLNIRCVERTDEFIISRVLNIKNNTAPQYTYPVEFQL